MSKRGLSRNTIDKFYTKENIATQCIKDVSKYVDIHKDDIIIEPSAGNGSFINEIKKMCNNYFFYDIKPEHKEIEEQDFLELDELDNKNIHFIGNPPFGRQSSMAIKFIKKCNQLKAKSISFILPKSFKKDSMKRHFPLNYHLLYETDIPKNSFLVDGKEADIPCIFQIWIYKDEKREEVEKLTPINFIFVKKDEDPDISFRRVGVNAGKISDEIEDKNTQSHYFIKFTKGLVNDNMTKLKTIQFSHSNTVGPRSISKQELIKEFNKVLS